MSESLTLPEAIRLKTLEITITNATKAFTDAGNALIEIRDKRLYRQHYKTFDDYCNQKWARDRRWAEYMMKAAVVVESLPQEMRTTVRNEASARALSCVPEEVRPAVIQHIREAHHPVTSTAIREAHVAVMKPAKDVDDTGCVIPEPLLELWNRRGEIEELMTAVSKVKCHINAFRSDKDELFCKVSQQVTEHLASAYSLLKDAVPYCVCGICEGRLEVLKNRFCKACSSTGFMSEREYNLLVPEEKRKIRKLANAQHNGK